MGFFSALNKIIQGKPVFEPNQNQKTGQVPTPPAPGMVVPQAAAPSGPKVYPRLYIGRVECRTSGSTMDVDITIENQSQTQVDLDRMEILGNSRDLGTFLRPGEEREFRVYNGPRPRATNVNRVLINLKTEPAGDYFQAEFVIDFRQEADGTYIIDRFRPIQIRDI